MSVSSNSDEAPREPAGERAVEIEVAGLVVRRRGRHLQFPDFAVFRGETLAISGPNGSGKSTLTLAIAGLLRPAGGRLTRSPSTLGYLPQMGGLYPSMTVSQNVAHFRRLFGARERFDPRMFPTLWTLGLEAHLDRVVGELSGGYFRLAAIGCVLCLGADALMLDEPMAGLDDDHRAAARLAISDAAPNLRFLVVTGHRHEDVSICERTVQLAGETR